MDASFSCGKDGLSMVFTGSTGAFQGKKRKELTRNRYQNRYRLAPRLLDDDDATAQ